MNLDYLRGNIWFANIPSTGAYSSVQTGYRPVVLVSSYEGILTNDIVTVVPCTTKEKNIEINVKLDTRLLDKPTWALTNQLVTLPKSSLNKHMGRLDEAAMHAVERGILISLGIAQATTSAVQATQEALASAKKDRQELENLLPQARDLMNKLNEIIKRVDGRSIQVERSGRVKRSPEQIAAFIREYEDPYNVKKEVAEAFGFSTPQQAYQFYHRYKGKVNIK